MKDNKIVLILMQATSKTNIIINKTSRELLSYIKSNVISAAICLAKKKQNKHEVFLGYNSNNKYFARWLWYIKSILPTNFGGFKIRYNR